MRSKRFGVAAVLAIAILASTGTCFALKKSDMNIGGIYFGQPIEKVIAKMGNPVDKRVLEYDRFGGVKHEIQRYEYVFVKNGVKFIVTADETVKGVIVDKTAKAAGLSTKAGIALGSSIEDVLKTYGKPDYDYDFDEHHTAKDPNGVTRLICYGKPLAKKENRWEEQLLLRFGFDEKGKLVTMDYDQGVMIGE